MNMRPRKPRGRERAIAHARLRNLAEWLEEQGIGHNQLARAIDRSPSGLANMIQRGNPTPEMQADINAVLTLSGYKIPDNIWIDIDGEDHAIPRRTLRHLESGDVVACHSNSPLSREKRLNRYFSPHQLDSRKELSMEPLTLNARRRFGLIADPFRAELHSIDDVFLTQEHSDAVEEMRRAAKDRDFIALIGEVGCGKTTCLQIFEQRLARNIRIIKSRTVDKAQLTGGNLYDAIIMDIAGELDIKSTIPSGREAKARKVRTLLKTLTKQDHSALLVIDEAHALNRDCLRALKRIHEEEIAFLKLVGIILIGQRELLPKLNDPTLREVGQRCARFEFRGLGKKTADYLQHKITKAGGKLEGIFDAAALREIQKVLTFKEGKETFGPYPLQVNSYCTLALNLADRVGENKITPALLNQIRPYSAQ